MAKKSTLLTSITLIVLSLMIIVGFYTILLIKSIERDAEIIEELGIIRGYIQRISKLELNKIESNDLIEEVDKLIQKYSLINNYPLNLKKAINNLHFSWKDFTKLIYEARIDPSKKNQLLKESEQLWFKVDSTVIAAQHSFEDKSFYFNSLILLIIIIIILILVIYFFIINYVKNKLEFLVNHDSLTGIYNRKYFNDALKNELDRANRYGNDLSLLVFDIDRFKSINDTYGHDIGDDVLIELSNIINSNIRSNDIFARIGGDEFAIIIPNTDISKAFDFSERLRKIVEKHKFKEVDTITLSIGISSFLFGDTNESIYKRADKMLYRAKNQGKNKVVADTDNSRCQGYSSIINQTIIS